jgi:hypothetical protein
VGVAYETASNDTITSLKLDGTQSMTAVTGSFFNNLANGNAAQFFYIANPTGSSGTPTITFSSTFTVGAVALQAWCITTATPTPAGGNGNGTGFAANISAALTVPSGGAIFGVCEDLNTSSPATYVFTNITADNNAIVIQKQFGPGLVGSGHATGGTGASVSVTCADSAANNGPYVLSIATMSP